VNKGMTKPKKKRLYGSFVGKEEVEQKVLEVVKNAGKPVSIQYVAFNTKLSWHTARAILFKLAMQGKIEAIDTTKSWIFRPRDQA